MKALRVLLLTVLAIGLLTATAYGAGIAVRHVGWPLAADREQGIALAPAAPASAPADPEAPPAQELAPADHHAEIRGVLEPGDNGEQVRELQRRLYQLAWLPELTTGSYDAATKDAVRGFQAKRGFEATGVVDQRTWRRLQRDDEDPDPRPDASTSSTPARRSWPPAPRATRCATCRRGSSRSPGSSATSPARYDDDHGRGGPRLPGQARDPGHRRGRPAHAWTGCTR